ncbi:MAG: DNA topoisomerase VI, partial [Methanomassiliicoccaceae archaeon]|nr:DNA topoisomerase VI [Methanomassiliicoccaceae archaeon]
MATNERHNTAMNNLTSIVESIYDQLNAGNVPAMGLPLRSKKNIEFDTQHNVWKYGDLQTTRTSKTVQGAQMMLRTVHTAEFINDMIRDNKSSTLREMYYISEGWERAKFNSQDESNLLA